MDPAIAYGIVFQTFEKGNLHLQGWNGSLIKKMVDECAKKRGELRRQSMVESLITDEKDGRHHVSGVMVNVKNPLQGRSIQCQFEKHH